MTSWLSSNVAISVWFIVISVINVFALIMEDLTIAEKWADINVRNISAGEDPSFASVLK